MTEALDSDGAAATVVGRVVPSGAGLLALGALVLADALLLLDAPLGPARAILGLATLVALPVLVLAQRLEIAREHPAERWLYALGLAVLGLLVGGLLVDLVLPLVGVGRPLERTPLVIASFVADVGLLSWRTRIPVLRRSATRTLATRIVRARVELAPGLAVAAVVLSVLGAVRLNNGAGGAVAVLGQLLAVAAVIVLLAGRDDRSVTGDSWVIGLAAAALLLSTSLRGWVITGHDIQGEYLVYQLAEQAGRWSAGTIQNAYNACLSVTILPMVLVRVCGLSGVVVFKVLLPLLFATVPPLTYLLARRFLARRQAVASAALLMAFPTFFTDMPYLARQEVAFFFLALMLLAATEPTLRFRARCGAAALLGVAVVLSHYSTTYVLLIAMVLALVGSVVLRLVSGTALAARRGEEHGAGGSSRLVLVHPGVVAVLLGASLIWAGPVTHTGAHAGEVVRQTVRAITGGFEGPSSSDTSYALIGGQQEPPRARLEQFVRKTLEYRRTNIPAADLLVPHPGPSVLHPTVVESATAPPTQVGRAIGHTGLSPTTATDLLRFLAGGVMQVCLLVGLLVFVRRRWTRRPSAPDSDVLLLSWGALGALALIVIVPNLSVDYGVLRAFQQTMLVVAPAMAVGLWQCARVARRHATSLAVFTTAALLLVLTGVVPALLGGNDPRIALSNSGTYYDRFHTSASEEQAIGWLARTDANAQYRSKIIGARNVLAKALADTGGAAPIADRLFPTLLTKDAYVFADAQLVSQHRSTVFYTGDLITYRYPVALLEQRLNVVYSAPGVRIFR